MQAKIYKDNFRENIFRSLIFTDVVVFVLSALLIAGIVFVLNAVILRHIYWTVYFATTLISEVLFYFTALLRIDNQPIYKIAYRALFFLPSKRKLRSAQVGAYFTNFTIQDDLIIRKQSVAKVFKITPPDITASSQAERNLFFQNIKTSLHMLSTKLQIIVRKEIAQPSDFTDHFMDLSKSIPLKDAKREAMIKNYKQDFLAFVEKENLLMVKQYGVFAVSANTQNPDEKVKAVGKVSDFYNRLSNGLSPAKVILTPLTNRELVAYTKEVLR
ncbi:MAG: hypothetical protein ACREHC_01530 [Candidatus Levyibacteriota bacterium]